MISHGLVAVSASVSMVVACGNAEWNQAASENAANKAEYETKDPSQCALLLHAVGHTVVAAELACHRNWMIRPVINWERTHLADDDGRLTTGCNHNRLTWLLHHWLTGLLHHRLTGLLHHRLTGLLHHRLAGLLHHWLAWLLHHHGLPWLLHHWLAGLLHHWLSWLLHHDGLARRLVNRLALRQKILLLGVNLFLSVHLLYFDFLL